MSQIMLQTGTGGVATLTAGLVIPNMLTGSAFEYVMRPARVAIGLVTDATSGLVTARITFGSTVEVESAAIPAWPSAGRGPIIPDDIMIRGVALGGNRIVVQITNGDVATKIVRCLVSILPA